MKKIVLITGIIVILFLILKLFLFWQNDTIAVTKYSIINDKIPPAFDGYKIIQLSDIQGKVFDTNNRNFMKKIENENADMLVFTGDLIDDGIPNSPDVISTLLKNAKLPKEIYAVSGNHDLWSQDFEKLEKLWGTFGNIKFLENKYATIIKDNEIINLYGIFDPNIWNEKDATLIVKKSIENITVNNGYNILLFHRANMLDLFKNEKFDLILSGHLHGGQVGIPFVGGLKSPHGDWFPKYSGGKYDVNNSIYIVSRGIGNTSVVPRIFNRPEIVVITLKNHK